tara:strand:- start:238 stop:441 length:204 start_codon:yes stop_codon:yes gene_type:complete
MGIVPLTIHEPIISPIAKSIKIAGNPFASLAIIAFCIVFHLNFRISSWEEEKMVANRNIISKGKAGL